MLRYAAYRRFSRVLAIAAIIAVMTAISTTKADDAWRRTTQGWERIEVRQAVAASMPTPPTILATESRLPHPLLFIVLQAALAIGGLSAASPLLKSVKASS